jgi:hypothetical protein
MADCPHCSNRGDSSGFSLAFSRTDLGGAGGYFFQTKVKLLDNLENGRKDQRNHGKLMIAENWQI